MENILSENESMLDLQIDPGTADVIETAGWWAKFSAIVVGVLLLLIIAIAIYVLRAGGWYTLETAFPLAAGLRSVFWFTVILTFGFCLAMILLLVNFAQKTRTGLEQPDQDKLESGFNSLKIYFIIYAIVLMLGFLGNLFSLFN